MITKKGSKIVKCSAIEKVKAYYFLCQDCGAVIYSNSWEKYHQKYNSCPFCRGDMCGCNDCVSTITKFQKENSVLDLHKNFVVSNPDTCRVCGGFLIYLKPWNVMVCDTCDYREENVY